MGLSIGIVGLPNVGKSTLFNALLKKQVALAANYPFATIEPNIGIVEVPDHRIKTISDFVQKDYSKFGQQETLPEKVINAVIQFHDIAGLVKGASQGQGLGNQFLSHIRETDAILQVVRGFTDENVIREGSKDPESDISTINTELLLADLQTIEKRLEKQSAVLKKGKSADDIARLSAYEKAQGFLNSGILLSKAALTEEDKLMLADLHLLTLKPMLYLVNVDETVVAKMTDTSDRLFISAKIESELAQLPSYEQEEYLATLGLTESGLSKVARVSYNTLRLCTYFTAGPKEVRAWTIKEGTKAPQAAGVIHTDFERGFIRAEVLSYNDLVAAQGFKAARDKGFYRVEGKDYVFSDGDIAEFRFSV